MSDKAAFVSGALFCVQRYRGNLESSLQQPQPYRDRVATTEVQNAWSSRDSRRLQIVPGSALAGNSNCKNRVTELRFLVISRQ